MTQITGVNDIVKAMKLLPRSTLKKAIRPAMKKAVIPIQTQAISNVKAVESSKATGLLAKSIIIKYLKGKPDEMRIAVAIAGKKFSKKGTRVGLYGSVLEYGKEHQKARPWLAPAIQQKAKEVISIFSSEAAININAAVEDAKK